MSAASLFSLARPVLMALDPERAHDLTIAALRALPAPAAAPDDPRLAVSAFGLRFPNPIGLAAGFDKNAEAYAGLFRLGFGFVEVGSLTPRAQEGNPKPRLFRLPADQGVINRFGFNNRGHEDALTRLAGRPRLAGPLGVNVGANKETLDRAADYALGITRFAAHADYFTLNVSSPNTPGLRDLQQRAALDDLLARSIEARDRAAETGPRRPVLVKIAPDLALEGLDDVVAVCLARRVDGMIVSNTTISRPADLKDAAARETGGLSGRPLFELSTRMLAETWRRVGGQFPLVGVGGITTGEAALAKIRAGASLIQLYSGLIYRGPGLLDEIKRALLAAGPLSDLVGRDA